MRTLTAIILLCAAIAAAATAPAKNGNNRPRGEALWLCQSANTSGKGDIWATVRAQGYLWDDQGGSGINSGMPNIYVFPEIHADVGFANRVSGWIDSRLLTYGKKFDGFEVGTKVALLKNSDLRLHQTGVSIAYRHHVPTEMPSLAGYRSGGTGFTPEGVLTEGGSLTLTGLYEADLIAVNSHLPIRACANLGLIIPLKSGLSSFTQYDIRAGAIYSGNGADVFIEYWLRALVNAGIEPKKFDRELGLPRTWEVAFAENPMYVTIGGRVRYQSGVTLFGAVPVLLSQNRGSAMTSKDNTGINQGAYPDEKARGITDAFDPWYPKWKIIAQLSIPLRYRQSGAELRRTFLLLKNRAKTERLEIEQELDNSKAEEADKQKRLEDIRKKREELQKPVPEQNAK